MLLCRHRRIHCRYPWLWACVSPNKPQTPSRYPKWVETKGLTKTYICFSISLLVSHLLPNSCQGSKPVSIPEWEGLMPRLERIRRRLRKNSEGDLAPLTQNRSSLGCQALWQQERPLCHRDWTMSLSTPDVSMAPLPLAQSLNLMCLTQPSAIQPPLNLPSHPLPPGHRLWT